MIDFLEAVAGEYNRMRSRAFAGDYAGVTHAGIALIALNTGRVFLTKRAFDETDAPDVRETWEMPGGGLKEGEEPYPGAVREFIEETGLALPADAMVVSGWRSPNGVYQGFGVTTIDEFPTDEWEPTTEVQDVGWFDHDAVMGLAKVGALRPEMVTMDWSVVFPETAADEESVMAEEEMEPALSLADITPYSIPVHGVLAPEETPTGDQRGFNAGSITSRPLRIPFSHQKSAISGHDGSVVVGSVDRLMRKDGLVHWEGQLMISDEADELAGLIAFFGRFGVSVDGDKGSLDMVRTEATEVLWFDKIRAAGLTAVAIPAFTEAYVAFGPHPDMPLANDTEALAASGLAFGDVVGTSTEAFRRGPGWVTDPVATRRIHDYWMPGHPGGAKIAWGTPGDFTRAKALIGEKIAANSPSKVRFLNQIIAQWHHDALGYWPGELGKPGNPPDTKANRERAARHAHSGDLMIFKSYTTEQRKKMADSGAALPDGSFPIADCEDLGNAIKAIGRASDPAKAKAHIRKRKAALGCSDVTLPWASAALSIQPMADDDPQRGQAYCASGCGQLAGYSVSTADPDWFGLFCGQCAPEYEDADLFGDYEQAIENSESIEVGETGWEAVLVSSAGPQGPPQMYFDKQPDTGALVIEEPDGNGYRLTYGYAGEWGVCHIGIDGRCVEVPFDDDSDFPDFHLGRTRTDGGYINTGLITYKVNHRGKQRILSESAEQQHFDNVANAWAAVRLGVDDRGIWFSGVVLPTVPEKDIVLIEAAGQVSGEWKYGALRALQAVNVPGFGVRRSTATYDEDGEVEMLVASAFGSGECEPSPADRMAALIVADAEVRFQKLRAEWSARDGLQL